MMFKPHPASNIRKGRKSVFREVGLEDDFAILSASSAPTSPAPKPQLNIPESPEEEKEFGVPAELDLSNTITTDLASEAEAEGDNENGNDDDEQRTSEKSGWLSKLAPSRRPRIKSPTTSSAPPPPYSYSFFGLLHRVTTISLLIAVVLPAFRFHHGGRSTEIISGADAGVVPNHARRGLTEAIVYDDEKRQDDSPTTVCGRWAGQTAILNGIMYWVSGRSKTSGGQEADTWNNDFVTLDLTQSWPITEPALTGLPRISGPPSVSLGYLWNDYDHLFLYGGQFSDDPPTDPASPIATWMYDIATSSWVSYDSPMTSAGNFSTAAGIPVQRSSEGAGVSVPEIGVSWYFGGHLDMYTTPGWSVDVARVYLNSLLEFTHPGYSNTGVDSLQAAGAPSGGAYRNITEGGIQTSSGFLERADGVLVYIPGWGPRGILLGLGGGSTSDGDTEDAFASMTTIDVYDIQSSRWYHQQTSGSEIPQVRVNPCAVVFSAVDASSFNIYMFGGQNLLPYGQQTQYSDVWILTVPSFTWIKVDPTSGSVPYPRAGHACAARDAQMIVWGGYINETIAACDNPGIYSFDASTLSWNHSFTAGDHDPKLNNDNTVLAGSFGYQVPGVVQEVVGGDGDGGATATTPAAGPATGGPFATGKPPVYTVTQPGATATVSSGAGTGGGSGGGSSNDGGQNVNEGALIAAGVIAGLLGAAALYLGFCAFIYRKQVGVYKKHVAAANRYSHDPDSAFFFPGNHTTVTSGGAGGAAAGGGVREKLRKSKASKAGYFSGLENDEEYFAWVGRSGGPSGAVAGDSTGDPSSKWASEGSSPYYTNSSDPSGSGLHQQQQPSPSSGSGPRRPSTSRRPTGGASSRFSEDLPVFGPGGTATASYDNYPFMGAAAGAAGAGAGDTSPGGIRRYKSSASRSTGTTATTASSRSAADNMLLDGREPSFFSVVLGPRRALRVVNEM